MPETIVAAADLLERLKMQIETDLDSRIEGYGPAASCAAPSKYGLVRLFRGRRQSARPLQI